MEPSRPRALGGRFTEWTEGRSILASDVLPPSPSAASRVITAPLPVRLDPPRVTTSAAPGSAPASPAPPPPSVPPSSEPPAPATPRTPPIDMNAQLTPPDGVAGSPGSAKQIKESPAADKLLQALSSYQRPYLNEETAETDGHPAATYAAPPRALAPGFPTAAPEPKTKLTQSIVREIDEQKARANGAHGEARAAREVPTVVTRGPLLGEAPTQDGDGDEEDATPIVATARPARWRGAVIAIAVVALLGAATLAVVWTRPDATPTVTDAVVAAPSAVAPNAARAAVAAQAPAPTDVPPVPTDVPEPPAADRVTAERAAPPPATARSTSPAAASADAPAGDAPVEHASAPAAPAASATAKPHPNPSSPPSALPIKSTFQVQN